MRLGAWKCDLKGSLAYKIYGNRQFLNVTVTVMSTIVLTWMNYKSRIESVRSESRMVEIVEIEDHPFSLCNTIQNIKVRLQTTSYFL
jgi:CTP synthase (UTP-ammonia lyase)